jgi:hypothetical protein
MLAEGLFQVYYVLPLPTETSTGDSSSFRECGVEGLSPLQLRDLGIAGFCISHLQEIKRDKEKQTLQGSIGGFLR